MSAARQGRTWEDIYGVEKAQQMREQRQDSEYRAKISDTLTGKSYEERYGAAAEDVKAKHREALTGVPRSEDTKAKISQAKLGQTFSVEHRAKLAEAKRGERNPELDRRRGEAVPRVLE